MYDATGNRILVVDDEPAIRTLVERWLKAEGYDCRTAPDAEIALRILEEEPFSLLVSDITMPGKSGMELLSIVRDGYGSIGVVMMTAVDDRSTAIQALKLGAYGYVIKPFDQNELVINVANALERRRLVKASEEYQRRLEAEVRARTADIRRREEEIALRLVWAAEYRDEDTGDHIRRIGLFSAVLAESLGWETSRVDDVRVAATMHDIGKIGVPDGILLKPGRLTPEEFDIVRKHPEIGASILRGSSVPLIQMAHEIALYHHEKWDGTGYPEGLAGTAIPESARIVAVVDVYDALVQNRVYRPALPEDEAMAIMEEDRGRHFDPRIFGHFLEKLPLLRRIREQIRSDEKLSLSLD